MNFKLAILAAASALSFGAHATTTDWGTHDPLEVAAAITSIGAFDDSYLFNLASDVNIFSTAVSNNLTSVLGIEGGMVSLFREAGAMDVAIGNFAFDNTTGSISYAFGAISAGDYYYAVTGTGTGSLGGFYTLSSTVSAVPEPQTYALLLGGLGAIGFMMRRRRA